MRVYLFFVWFLWLEIVYNIRINQKNTKRYEFTCFLCGFCGNGSQYRNKAKKIKNTSLLMFCMVFVVGINRKWFTI